MLASGFTDLQVVGSGPAAKVKGIRNIGRAGYQEYEIQVPELVPPRI